MQPIILHCDLNNFFASASLANNPSLKMLPVAICGDAKKRHGIVLAKNNIAKKYGILTAETIWEAKRKCPELITISPDYELYEHLSKKVQKIYLDYTDKVEPFGIDECWLDITNPNVDFKVGEDIANDIRKRVKEECDVTVSVGVSFTKSLAKLGSDLKKPDAVTVIDSEVLKNKIWKMPCNELLMVGKSTYNTLISMGIFTIGDLAGCYENALVNKLGKNGVSLRKMARGEERDKVISYYHHVKPKSISQSATTEKDLVEKGEVFAAIIEFSEYICYKLRKENLLASSVAVNIRNADFEYKEFREALDTPTDLSGSLSKAAMTLFEKNNCLENPIRAIGVRAINLIEAADAKQLSLFEASDPKNENILEQQISDIRDKYGKNSLKRAICLDNKVKPSSPGFYKK